ncbi:MAG: hypothetical protein ABI539_07060, partial [Acidobacteriota bacterium]
NCNLQGDWNGVADGIQLNYGGKLLMLGGQFAGRDFQLTFIDADVNTSTNVITKANHGIGSVAGVVAAVSFSNSGGALPGGLSAVRTYWFRTINANTGTVHATLADAQAGTNILDITSAAGGGTHTMRLSYARHTAFASGDVNTTTNVVTVASHGIGAAGITHGVIFETSAADLPAPLLADHVYFVRVVDANSVTVHPSGIDAESDANAIDFTDGGSGTHIMRTTALNTYGRPRSCIRITGQTPGVDLIGVQNEAVPYFLDISNINDNSFPVNLYGCSTQGLVKIRSNTTVNVFGGSYYCGAFEDEVGVSANVHIYGAQFHMVDGAYYDVGGTEAPRKFDRFIGTSIVRHEDCVDSGNVIRQGTRIVLGWPYNVDSGTTAALSLESTYGTRPLLRFRRINNNEEREIDWESGIWGSGDYLNDWWFLKPVYGHTAAKKGVWIDAHIRTNGRVINSLATALTPGSTVALDAALSKRYTLTPGQDCTINASNVIDGDEKEIRILTSGTTPWTITFGTGFKTPGTLSTGSADGKVFKLKFSANGTTLEEESRTTAM